jgi:hypothetical protein
MPHDLADCRRLIGLALLVGLLLGLRLAAQGTKLDDVPGHYFNEDQFEIPFAMNPGRNVRQVVLWASSDGTNFDAAATSRPDAKKFTYTAKTQGWHYFVVQVEEYDGKKTPATVNRSVVDLQVCVDKEKPTITLNPVKHDEKLGNVAVDWEIKDNQQVNVQKMRLEYRPAKGGAWKLLNFRKINPGQFTWAVPEKGDYEVRLTAYDAAGNSAEAKTTVSAASGSSGGGQAAPAPDAPNKPAIHHVKSKTFKLEYKIDNVGKSSVKKVEVWMTRDMRQWSKYRDDAPADPSSNGGYQLTVTSAGRWGFTLRPVSGVGRAAPAPSVNEQPQIWINVDETLPLVRILDVKVGEGADDGTITVSYEATDAWMKDKPISIYYAETKDAKPDQWKLIEGNLANTGTAKLQIKEKLGQVFEFWLHVTAVDEAGNVGQAAWKDSVKVDTLEPKATITNVIGVNGKQEP